jgi:hypothetical protein
MLTEDRSASSSSTSPTGSSRFRNGETTTIRARRADAEVEVTGASPEEAAGIAFARALRSGDRDEPPEDD